MPVTGVEALLTALHPELDSNLQEAGLDSLCKLATEPSNRQHLTDKVLLATNHGHATFDIIALL